MKKHQSLLVREKAQTPRRDQDIMVILINDYFDLNHGEANCSIFFELLYVQILDEKRENGFPLIENLITDQYVW